MYNIDIQTNPYSSFNYWFIPTTYGVYEIYKEGALYGSYYMHKDTIKLPDNTPIVNPSILVDFENWKARPEGRISSVMDYPETADDAIELYDTLIVGIAAIRTFKSTKQDPDQYIEKFQSVLSWLHSTDFYTAPASTVYHDSEPHGLLYHTLRVIFNIWELHSISKFQKCELDSLTLCALTHDWCKIGLYSTYQRNVKSETTGKWEQVTAYRRDEPTIPLGHGVESLYKAMKVFKLNDEEAAAIRWHMGEYNVASNEVNELHAANERYPLVQMLQFADRLSIVKY